jgi:hypothetical protein
MTDVTVFFRGTDKWRSSEHREPESDNSKMLSYEIISDRDVINLYDLSMCILHIRKKATDEHRKTVYDNSTLGRFMDEFTLVIDEISKKKNIKDYISHVVGPRFEISVPVKYE